MIPLLSHISDSIRQLKPYQPGRPISEVARERGITQVVKLASNENPLGAGRCALDAMRTLDSDALSRYPDANGTALREAIAAHLAVDGVTAECVLLGNGSNEILELAAHLTLHAGTAAVYSEHAFIVYTLATAARRAAAKVVPAADGFAHDLSAMTTAAQDDAVRLLFIANPNNPTGTWHPPEAIRRLLTATPPHVLVVLDEAYHEYAGGGSETLRLLAEFPNLLITRTFSKIHGIAGLRAGYGIANAEVAEFIHRIRQPFNMNIAAQRAALAALTDTAHIKESLETNRRGLEMLGNAFTQAGIAYLPSYGNFLTFRPPQGAQATFEHLLNNGLILRTLHEYGMADWLRVTIGTEANNAHLLHLLQAA